MSRHSSPRSAGLPAQASGEVPMASLDEGHRAILSHLARLRALSARLRADGTDDAATRTEAAAIEAFFSGTSRQHHQAEETQLFPVLMQTADPTLASTLQRLRQDHGWIEENWLELAPKLRAISEGAHWVDPSELQHDVDILHELCTEHIALEEALVYPRARADATH